MSGKMFSIAVGAAVMLALPSIYPASAQQADQPAVSSTSGLEEIVVTARRREEKLQSVPVSVTAFSGAQIEQNEVVDFNDLSHLVPSMTVYSGTSRYSENFLSIRGLGAGSTITYFAEAPNPTAGILGQTFDMEDVQVLVGPQGTLFGRSAIGGAFLFDPKRPTSNFEGYAQVTFGNYSDYEFEGAVNIPIVQDKVLLRIAGQRQQRDGFTIDAGPTNTGKDYDNRDYWSGRVGLTLRPTDDIENYLVFSYFYNHDNGTGSHLNTVDPNGVSTFGGYKLSQLLPNAWSVFDYEASLGPWRTALDDPYLLDKDLYYSVTDIAKFDINDDLTVKNVASNQIQESLTRYDFDGSLLTFSEQGLGAPYTKEPWDTANATWTEELQLLGKSLDEKLNWVVGGFLSFEHPIAHTQFGQAVLYGGPAGATTYEVQTTDTTSKEQAVYAQGTYDLGGLLPALEGLSLTGGYRYTWDYVSLWTQEFGTFGACPAGFSGPNCGSPASSNMTHRGTFNLSLDYQLTPDVLAYVRSGRGFLGGSTNLSNPVGYQVVLPESLTDVELGVKTDWELWGIKGRTNADIFQDWFTDIQESVGLNIPGRGVVGATINAAQANLKGFETQGTIIPVAGLEIGFNYAYEEGGYTQFYNPAAVPTDQSGLPFRFTPRHKGTLSLRYALPIDPMLGDLSVTVLGSAQTKVHIAPDIEPDGDIVGYGLLNFNVDWKNIVGYPVDASFFMTNATDTVYRIANASAYYQVGFVPVTYGEPRMFGVKLKYRFGPGGEAETETAAAYAPPPAQAPSPAPRVTHNYMVFFDFNRSDLTPQALAIVDQAANNATPAKATEITVTGHTDTVGSEAYNMRLSRRRAESVAAELEKEGITSSEIEIVAKGKHDLLVPTGDGVREPQNRRVTIVYSANQAGS
jgi:iron complex outermembrane receptor protein